MNSIPYESRPYAEQLSSDEQAAFQFWANSDFSKRRPIEHYLKTRQYHPDVAVQLQQAINDELIATVESYGANNLRAAISAWDAFVDARTERLNREAKR
ncbi:MAG: hypothetical protein AAFQ40_12955 [Cyanobacteria bacterium J06623_5]